MNYVRAGLFANVNYRRGAVGACVAKISSLKCNHLASVPQAVVAPTVGDVLGAQSPPLPKRLVVLQRIMIVCVCVCVCVLYCCILVS